MTVEIGLTLAVLAAVMIGLIASTVTPDMILLGGLAALVVSGVLPADRALAGFGNEGLATIAALFVVAEGLRRTGGVGFVVQGMLGRPRSSREAQLRVMFPVVAMSSILNNTPVVAAMMPVVTEWGRRNGIAVAQLLLPLSYASIFGGLITLVGTSTTLVVNGLMISTPGLRGIGMFEIAWFGVPGAVLGVAYVALLGRRLLPAGNSVRRQLGDVREYTVELLVSPQSPIVGRTLEQAGLRHLQGMFLAEILRGEHVLAAPAPTARIEADDRLVFVGVVESVVDLQRIPGLTPAADQLFKIGGPRSDRCLVEAVVSGDARFCGMSIREAKFRTRYNAVVIAVARQGERVQKKIGDIVLQAGDTLLLETHPSFADVQRNSRDFYLVGRVENSTPVQHERAWMARLVLLGMLVSVATEWLTMLQAACLAGGTMTVCGCLKVAEAKRAMDWSVLLGIGAGLGLGAAVQSTGLGHVVGAALVGGVGADPLAVLAVMYLVTTVLANLITTKAAAVLMFPVAVDAAARLGADFMPFAIALVVASASAYATSVGYQTNLMVAGPGGYRGIDFLRVGGPLSVLMWIFTVLWVPWVWPF